MLVEEQLEALEQCLETLPHSAPEAARLVRQILPHLKRWSYEQQMGQVMLDYLQGMLPDCRSQLAHWVAEVRQPGLHRSYALPGAPPPIRLDHL